MKITLKRSVIGRPQEQRDTVKALGLNKIGQTREVADSPAIRGMIRKIEHLTLIHI